MGQIGYFFNIIFTFPIFNVLMVLYRIIGDFGLSIIVLTLLVKLILFPLTLKQLKSMKATQALQPQMAEIRKKYAKDQLAQSRAMQDLYKEYGISPLAGSCLPLLVQMPVLFGLFYALSAVLRSAKTVGDINKLLYPFIPAFAHFPNINLTWFTFISPAWQISLGAPGPNPHLTCAGGNCNVRPGAYVATKVYGYRQRCDVAADEDYAIHLAGYGSLLRMELRRRSRPLLDGLINLRDDPAILRDWLGFAAGCTKPREQQGRQ